MKRTFATLGVVGLGLLSLTAPAMAASDRVIVCHAGGTGATVWEPLEFSANGIGGHAQHPTDIIPPTPKAPTGLNWTNAGKITYIASCAPLPPGEEPPVYPPVVVDPPVVVPPVVVPPVDVPPVVVPPVVEQPVVETPVETPVVETPVVTPVVETPVVAPVVTPSVEQPAVVPPVTVPPAAAAVVVPEQAAAAAVATTGLGTNQGYNAQTAVGGSNSPSWLAGAGALAAAGAAVAFRRSRRTLPLAD
jgi:hypothetical protein